MTKRFAALATLLFLALPAVALAADESGDEEKFNPASEWTLHEWIPIHLGPIDMSINKAVAYLLLGAVFGIPSFIWAVTARRNKRTPGQCGNCGYDLRATPERCPECGRANEAILRPRNGATQ